MTIDGTQNALFSTPSSDRTLLIAGCGYLGSRVARRMVALGWSVFAITRDPVKAHQLQQEQVIPVIDDITARSVANASGYPEADAVLWCVGYDPRSVSSRREAWVGGFRRLFGRLHPDHPPSVLVLASSVSVYGDRAGAQVDEATQAEPSTESGSVCLELEQAAVELVAERSPGTRLIVLRYAGLYGPGRLLRRVEDLKAGTVIPAEGSGWLNLVHIDDAAEVTVRAITSASFPHLMNVVSSQSVRRADYYGHLAECVGAPPPVFAPVKRADPGGAGPSPGRSSGNKRVVSRYADQIAAQMQFAEFRDGLAQALREFPPV